MKYEKNIAIENLSQKFETIYKQLLSPKFLEQKGLSGEVPFFISTYTPAQDSEVHSEIKRVQTRLNQSGVYTLNINLYELTLEILQERNLLHKIIDSEQRITKKKLFSTLSNVLDPNTYLNQKIKEKIEADDRERGFASSVIFISGVGSVYPFIRSHTVLNNLQNIIKDRPMLLFFPGIYDGNQLSLFGKIKDDNYYRAFNIEKYKL